MGDQVDPEMALDAYRKAMTPKSTTGDYTEQFRQAFPVQPTCPCCQPRCPSCGRPYPGNSWPPALPWWPQPGVVYCNAAQN